jgi:hypothetical protein
MASNRRSTQSSIMSLIISPEMPPPEVVSTAEQNQASVAEQNQATDGMAASALPAPRSGGR